jgi:hypothetical protein
MPNLPQPPLPAVATITNFQPMLSHLRFKRDLHVMEDFVKCWFRGSCTQGTEEIRKDQAEMLLIGVTEWAKRLNLVEV